MENNALGYSGTNSGGQIVIQNSTFDNNKDGFDTNTALTGDPPPPQDGRCGGKLAAPSPGDQLVLGLREQPRREQQQPERPDRRNGRPGADGHGDDDLRMAATTPSPTTSSSTTVPGAVLFLPYPDGNTTSDGKTCTQAKGIVATALGIPGVSCLFDPQGDVLSNNKFSGNGTFGNPSNADFGNLLIAGHEPVDCFSGNTEWDSTFTSLLGPATNANVADSHQGQTPSTCGTKTPKAGLLGGNTDLTMLVQVECDAGVLSGASCASAHYPQPTAVVMHPLPSLPSMPNPCVNVPANLWCRGGVPTP